MSAGTHHRRRVTDPRWQVIDSHGTPHGAPRARTEAARLLDTLRILEPSIIYRLVPA